MKSRFIGKKCIVRGNRSGVFFGKVVSINGQEVELSNFRKLHYWDGACAIEELALNGTNKPENCRFTVFVEYGLVSDMIQINECTEKAIESIGKVKLWTIKK